MANPGKKAVMAVTGLVMTGYLVVHMAGNLQLFRGREALNAYARFLHGTPLLLWSVRVLLLASVVLHVALSWQLARRARAARPIAYASRRTVAASFASLTMLWSGIAILVFVVYHVLDLTLGVANPDFRAGDVDHNVRASLATPAAAVAYLLGMGCVALHLRHGLWSSLQSLGLGDPRWTAVWQRVALALTLVIIGGFVLVPAAVLLTS